MKYVFCEYFLIGPLHRGAGRHEPSETEFARADALDERIPFGLREGQGGGFGVLRVADQVRVVDFRDLDAGGRAATAALPPCGRVQVLHLGTLHRLMPCPALDTAAFLYVRPRRAVMLP